MNRSHLKNIAYQQQINHLALAQTQALKILIEQSQPCKLNVENALAYYDLVRIKLGPQQFPEFLEIMRENRNPNSDCMVIISKVCQLFKNYPELLQGFGMFLPPTVNLQVQTAGRFLVKGDKNDIFPLFIKTEDDYDPNRSTESTLTAVSESDSTMEDLPDDYEEPEKAESISKESRESEKVDSDYAMNYLAKVKERFKDQPEVNAKFIQVLDSVRKDCLENERIIVETDVFNDVSSLFTGHEDLIEQFKFFVPNAKFPYSSEQDPISDDPIPEIESQFQNEDSIPFCESPDDEYPIYSLVNDPSLAAVGKYGSYEEHLFFDKVRKALYHREVYDNFLKCLMLFNEDVVTRSELVKIASSFLGKFPDLLKELKDMLGFNESGNNIEAIPLKIIKYENCRLDPEVALDIDYATGGRNGASYRALPKDLKQPKCSGRTLLCKEVLNDTWVSFPSWSEDSTFVTSCKTEFEEMIYRCEDERFELDMAIRANAYTIQVLENVQKKINKMTAEEKNAFFLDNYLGGTSTVLHQKALHRCYGDKTDELVEGLKRNPCVAVPIVLKRLRGKEEEWKEKQRHFNNIWREQMDNYYIKSLDHQGINFKQNDSKSFRSKSLLNEMEMVFAEKKENSVVNGSTFHFLLEFKEKCVFYDAINLICQYLKKLPGIYRDDRRRIELVVRHFIPDFFCFPRTIIVEDEAVDENDEEEEEVVPLKEENGRQWKLEEIDEKPVIKQEPMDIENDIEIISGPTSPSGSAALSKDEELSDPEESNSVEENELSEDSEKNSFIEDSDIFDKLDTILPTNLPYTLFFVSKSWYVFFRQFHILCQRLSRLLHESNRKDVSAPVKADASTIDDGAVESKPSYTELISKLSLLLSGAIDYSQFEDEARSLFGIHAFVSFTMDKLILNIVRQLQQIVGDDICKQCTAFFFQHNKVIANGTYSSPLESAQIEKEYLKKVERVMNEENCFKVLWHKKDLTLTIELIEHVFEHVDDPYEVEKWSNYLDIYVNEDNVAEELLSETPGLPVFLPRNLRRQKEFWKRKVVSVENLWKKRYSPTYLQKNLPLLRKRKTFDHSSPVPSKISQFSRQKLDESMSVCSETCVEPENVTETSLSQQAAVEASECDKTFDSDKFDDNSKMSEKETETVDGRYETEMETEDTLNELNASENSNISTDAKGQDSESVKSFTGERNIFFCTTSEASNEGSLFFNQVASFTDAGKGENDTLDSTEGSVSMREEEHPFDDSVAAFHDITDEVIEEVIEEVTSDVIIEVSQESETFEIITVDSGDEINVISDTESVDKKEVKENESKEDESKEDESQEDESKEDESKEDECKEDESKEDESKEDDYKEEESKEDDSKEEESKEEESRPRREKPPRKTSGIKTRKNRPFQEYVKRRNRRSAARAQKERKARNARKELEDFDYATFDYTYFSELSDEDKYEYLATQHLILSDDTEGKFKRENFRLLFVQHCDMFLYRLNCLTKAKDIHQQVCEIKTSNFDAWHSIWLDRYVTSAMLKFCNDWFYRSDPEKYKLVCVTMSDCTKPPYIPYCKYRIRYFKTLNDS